MLFKAHVVSIEELAGHYYHLLLKEPHLAVQSQPGQFLYIRIGEGLTPFLRRPFSVAGAFPREGTVQIIFRLAGEGTAILGRIKKDAALNCMGPLGKGFRTASSHLPAVLLAGGAGVAPLLFLAQVLAAQKRKVILFYGAVSGAELLPLQKLLPQETEVHLATEDGSRGYHGRVTALFTTALQRGLLPAEIFACGPRPMLQVLALKNKDWKLPLQFSLEERMACGLGACQGCVVKIRLGGESMYSPVCHDGPVFDAQEVEW